MAYLICPICSRSEFKNYPSEIKRLLAENGILAVIMVNTTSRWQKLRIWIAITRILEKYPCLGGMALKLPLGDNMLVLARKKL